MSLRHAAVLNALATPFGAYKRRLHTAPVESTAVPSSLYKLPVHKPQPAVSTQVKIPMIEKMKTFLFGSGVTMAGMPVPAAHEITSAETNITVELPPSHHTTVLKLQEIYSAEDAQMVAQHLSDWWTVKQVESNLHWIHETYGLPWWGTIIATTLLLRVLLAPVNIALLRNSLRMKIIAPEVEQLNRDMAVAVTPQAKKEAADKLVQLFKDNKCHPLKNCITFPILLPPTILSIFGAIHNLSMSEPTMALEGAAFFPDLVQADPTNLLPIASALTWLMNVESGAGVYYHSRPHLKTAIRTTACMCWALSATMPSGVLIFWLTSNIFAIVRGYITRHDSVRRALNIPLQSEIEKLKHLPTPTHF